MLNGMLTILGVVFMWKLLYHLAIVYNWKYSVWKTYIHIVGTTYLLVASVIFKPTFLTQVLFVALLGHILYYNPWMLNKCDELQKEIKRKLDIEKVLNDKKKD